MFQTVQAHYQKPEVQLIINWLVENLEDSCGRSCDRASAVALAHHFVGYAPVTHVARRHFERLQIDDHFQSSYKERLDSLRYSDSLEIAV